MDKDLEAQLSAAIAAGDFDRANTLIASYAQALRDNVAKASTGARREAILSEALTFLRDRLHLARIMRAHLAARLKTTAGVCQYGSPQPASNRWQFDG